MSLVAKVEQLYAEAGDGLLNAVKHVAGELEKLAAGGAAPLDLAKIEADIHDSFAAKASAFFDELGQKVTSEVTAIEGGVRDLQSRIAKLEHQVPQLPPATPPQAAAELAAVDQSAQQQPAQATGAGNDPNAASAIAKSGASA